MNVADYAGHDGVGLAGLIGAGEVSATEVAQVALTAIEALNPGLNAVIASYPDRPARLRGATLPGGPLAGVPMLLKDLVSHEAGQIVEMGSRLARGLRMPHATELVRRYLAAGLVPLGRTTTPEFGYCTTTESVLCGPTRNPWNVAHSPGGSSGGSAAAVAARLVPIGHASDGGGSIRIPAACCGLVGMKPTRGRNSLGPDIGDAIAGFGCEHVVTRSVRDSAAALDATQGVLPGDPFVIPPPARPYLEEAARPPGRLRIAWTAAAWGGEPIDPENVAAVHAAAKLLESLGHTVFEASPRYDHAPFLSAAATIWAVGTGLWVEGVAAATGRTPGPDTLETSVIAVHEAGRRITGFEYQAALIALNTTCRQVAPFFAGCDVLMTPTCAQPAWRLGEIDANAPGWTLTGWTEHIFRRCPFTMLFNATGQPAVSLPLAMSSGGLPIGIQFVGQWADEATLFRLAGQLETAQPWAQRRPGVCA